MKKLYLFFFLIVVLSKTSYAQAIDTPVTEPRVIEKFLINGRVIGFNLEDLDGATIINVCSAEKVSANSHGIYRITAAKGDTLIFEFAHHSKEVRPIKYPKEKLNVIMVKRKTDDLPANYSRREYNNAVKADAEFYRILEKDARLEGKWNY